MNTRVGLGLPNRHLLEGEAERIVALGCSDYVGLDLFPEQWKIIHDLQPNAVIHARVWLHWGDSPELAGEALMAAMIDHPEVATWRVGNEPKVEIPNLTPQEWLTWQARLGTYTLPFRNNGHRVLFVPAVSPGIEYDRWLTFSIAAAEAGHFDGLDVHAYGSPEEVRAVIEPARQHYKGVIYVTEHNFGAGREYDLARYAADLPAVLSLCRDNKIGSLSLFIWEWNHPDVPLPTTVNVKGTVVEPALKALCNEGAPMPTETEFDRWANDVWKRAGQGGCPDTALANYWKESARRGHYLGRPEGPEHPSEAGVPYQEFASAVLHYKGGEVREGLPF